MRTEDQVRIAFDLITKANTVTLLDLGEMEAIVNRALSGEFDSDIGSAPVTFLPMTYGMSVKISKDLIDEKTWPWRKEQKPLKIKLSLRLKTKYWEFRMWLAKKIAGYDFTED